MKPLPMFLKIKLIILAFIFPVTFALAGFIIGTNANLFDINIDGTIVVSVLGSAGFILGILLNLVCYYRKLFAIAIYQTPIPLALFFAFHWVSNFFVGEMAALVIGAAGLAVGLWLNQELVMPYQFYKIPKRILAILYLFYSIIAMGFFMGVPVFNIFLGLFAGNYLAVRIISYSKQEEDHNKNINQGSLYSALVILIISAIAGLIALSDIDAYVQLIKQLVHIDVNSDNFIKFLLLAGSTATLAQYFITRFAAHTMLELFSHRKSN